MSFAIKTIYTFITFSLFFAIFSNTYSAINIDNFVGPKELVVAQSPKISKPKEEIMLTVSQGLVDIKRTKILWYLDGKLEKEGVGATTFSFITKEAGRKSTVRVVAQTNTLGTLSKTIIFTPASVDLLWEANTYTPPFYYGKPLPSPRSPIKVVAVTNFESGGKKIDNKDLIFEWEVNRRRMLNESGVGKNTLTTSASSGLTDMEISVVVSTLDEELIAENEIKIRTVPVDLVLYEESPLYGLMLEKAIRNSLNIFARDITLVAEPYFFNKEGVENKNIVYEWLINNEKKNSLQSQNKLTIGIGKEQPSGRTVLRINADNIENVLQSVVRSLNINF